MIEEFDSSSSTISRKIRQLKEAGMVKEHRGKSRMVSGMIEGNPKIYIPTLKGVEHGGLASKFQKITEGSAEESIISSFGIGLADMHGKIHIKIPINYTPEDDGLVWKGPNELNNGVKQYIRFIEKGGDRVCIERYEGPKSSSVILKPRFLSHFDDSPEDLVKRFTDVAWGIWTDLEMKGYELAFPEGPKGEAKFTLHCKAFEEIGYTETDNVTIDYSKGKPEIHPKTGDLQTNQLMAELLLDSDTIRKKFEKDYFTEEQKVRALDEVGQLSKMAKAVERTQERMEQTENKTEVMADYMAQMANSFNDLMDKIGKGEEKLEDFDIERDPPDSMFG